MVVMLVLANGLYVCQPERNILSGWQIEMCSLKKLFTGEYL